MAVLSSDRGAIQEKAIGLKITPKNEISDHEESLTIYNIKIPNNIPAKTSRASHKPTDPPELDPGRNRIVTVGGVDARNVEEQYLMINHFIFSTLEYYISICISVI